MYLNWRDYGKIKVVSKAVKVITGGHFCFFGMRVSVSPSILLTMTAHYANYVNWKHSGNNGKIILQIAKYAIEGNN